MPANQEKGDEKRLITVSFPLGLLAEVDKLVKKAGSKYISRADFCRAAVRRLLDIEKNTEWRRIPTDLPQSDREDHPPDDSEA